jgi:putative membrane protein
MARTFGCPLRAWLLIAVLAALAISAFHPANPADFILEHSLTAAALIALWLLDRGRPISNGSALCLVAFLLLHVLGAHYTYSFGAASTKLSAGSATTTIDWCI